MSVPGNMQFSQVNTQNVWSSYNLTFWLKWTIGSLEQATFLFLPPAHLRCRNVFGEGFWVPIVGGWILGNVVPKEAFPRNIGYGWPTVVSLMAASALGLGSYHAQGTMSVCSIGATPEVPAQTGLVRQ